jgi:hypothetical protein
VVKLTTGSATIQLIVITAMLIRALGPSALAGIAVIFFITPAQGKIMRASFGMRADIAQVRIITPA